MWYRLTSIINRNLLIIGNVLLQNVIFFHKVSYLKKTWLHCRAKKSWIVFDLGSKVTISGVYPFRWLEPSNMQCRPLNRPQSRHIQKWTEKTSMHQTLLTRRQSKVQILGNGKCWKLSILFLLFTIRFWKPFACWWFCSSQKNMWEQQEYIWSSRREHFNFQEEKI